MGNPGYTLRGVVTVLAAVGSFLGTKLPDGSAKVACGAIGFGAIALNGYLDTTAGRRQVKDDASGAAQQGQLEANGTSISICSPDTSVARSSAAALGALSVPSATATCNSSSLPWRAS